MRILLLILMLSACSTSTPDIVEKLNVMVGTSQDNLIDIFHLKCTRNIHTVTILATRILCTMVKYILRIVVPTHDLVRHDYPPQHLVQIFRIL